MQVENELVTKKSGQSEEDVLFMRIKYWPGSFIQVARNVMIALHRTCFRLVCY